MQELSLLGTLLLGCWLAAFILILQRDRESKNAGVVLFFVAPIATLAISLVT